MKGNKGECIEEKEVCCSSSLDKSVQFGILKLNSPDLQNSEKYI
jgi:hypothetical protein